MAFYDSTLTPDFHVFYGRISNLLKSFWGNTDLKLSASVRSLKLDDGCLSKEIVLILASHLVGCRLVTVGEWFVKF